MATTIPALVETSDPPLATDSDEQFDAKAFPWAASLDPFGQSVSAIAIAARDNAEEALAAALGGDLPPLTGEALKFLRVKADESGAEFAEVPEPVTQSEATWEAGTSTTEGIVSPAKVRAAFNSFEQQIGVGQTWQDVSASRSPGTSYQNTTGRPIEWAGYIGTNQNVDLEISADNSSWFKFLDHDAHDRCPFSIIVPDGYYYRTTGSDNVSIWLELR